MPVVYFQKFSITISCNVTYLATSITNWCEEGGGGGGGGGRFAQTG